MRVGMGYDVHRLGPDRKLIIGGVEIPYEIGLIGHSDADVLLHAIMDALLGAAALGDIGKHFPDTDERYKGKRKLFAVQDIVRHRADQRDHEPGVLVFKFRPQKSRRIEQLHAFADADPLLPLCHARLIPGLRGSLSRKGIDKGGFTDIGNTGYHGTHRAIHDSSSSVALQLLSAGLVDQRLQLSYSRPLS